MFKFGCIPNREILGAFTTNGSVVYGRALQERLEEMAQVIMKSDMLLLQLGRNGSVPVHVATALPELPDGYQFIIVTRSAANPEDIEESRRLPYRYYSPYAWYVYAARREACAAFVNGQEWADEHGQELWVDEPVFRNYDDDEGIVYTSLPLDSLAWVQDAWIPCDAIRSPFRNDGKEVPLPPLGYGIVWHYDYHAPDCNGRMRVLAVPFGTYSWADEHTHEVIDTFVVGPDGCAVNTTSDHDRYCWPWPKNHLVYDWVANTWERRDRTHDDTVGAMDEK